jgi:biofilm PGA synthesis N-glycosyltransferase PgaC
MATKELIVAPRTAASSRVVELAPVSWSEPKDSVLIRAATRADGIVVIADNCDDKTEQIARRFRGVTVMRTVGNTERKVGALNQG